MIDISRAAVYDAPAGAIFAVITDLASYPAWQPGVESASLAGEGPARQRARIRQVRIVMGRRTEIGLTITRLVPAELLTLATGPGATPAVRETYRLRPAGDGCRLEFRLTLDGIPAMVEHLARAQLTRQTQQMQERLATIAASRQPPAASRQPPAASRRGGQLKEAQQLNREETQGASNSESDTRSVH